MKSLWRTPNGALRVANRQRAMNFRSFPRVSEAMAHFGLAPWSLFRGLQPIESPCAMKNPLRENTFMAHPCGKSAKPISWRTYGAFFPAKARRSAMSALCLRARTQGDFSPCRSEIRARPEPRNDARAVCAAQQEE